MLVNLSRTNDGHRSLYCTHLFNGFLWPNTSRVGGGGIETMAAKNAPFRSIVLIYAREKEEVS